MDVLFSVGALCFGIKLRFWIGAAIAAANLTATTLAIVAVQTKTPAVALTSVGLFLVGICSALVVYVRGLRLPKDHPRRETCELLGAAGVVGALGILLVVIAAAAGAQGLSF